MSADLTEHRDSTFTDLDNYGGWANISGYGNVWKPYAKGNWQPYLDGQWVWTDQGWMWDSNEPFGWIVYHYGYWQFTEKDRWFWIPGYDWAPARVWWYCSHGYAGNFVTLLEYKDGFVDWEHSNDFIGWTPAPSPDAEINLIYDKNYVSKLWVFIREQNFVGQNAFEFRKTSKLPDIAELHSSDNRHAPEIKYIEYVSHSKIDLVEPAREEINEAGRQLMKVTIR
jgi:hypothetical protein